MDKQAILDLFFQLFNTYPETIEKLPEAGSSRKYYRLGINNKTYIGASNNDKEENKAFFEITQAFLKSGVSCPKIIAIADNPYVYILEDLGDDNLFTYLSDHLLRKGQIREIYQKILRDLLKMQTEVPKHLDTSYCYPREAFDKQSIQWDLNYFKYSFLKPAGIFFDEQLLENDFHYLSKTLLKNGTPYFMYRDFQSRNIMLHKGEPYYIDYQGGRKGTLYYDVASLLFEGKINLPFSEKEHLLRYYYEISRPFHRLPFDVFEEEYYEYVLIRLLQAFGAYGFRGLMQRKPLFIASIQYGLKNFEWLIAHNKLPRNMPELERCIQAMIKTNDQYCDLPEESPLCVKLFSFSYIRRGIPQDYSTHGGGFIFDCRLLTNPGRIDAFKELNGFDQPVIDFFQHPDNKKESSNFFKSTETLCLEAIKKYLKNGYSYLSLGFGCTGGQHRSVYMTNKMEESIQQHFGDQVHIVKEHMELHKKK